MVDDLPYMKISRDLSLHHLYRVLHLLGACVQFGQARGLEDKLPRNHARLILEGLGACNRGSGETYPEHVLKRSPPPATILPCFAIGQQADEAKPPGRIGGEAKPDSPLGADSVNIVSQAFCEDGGVHIPGEHSLLEAHRCSAVAKIGGPRGGRSGAMRD
jgi:hypothetical protein